MVDALEEVKRTGNALVLHCVHPQHVPNLLDSSGEECIREQRGDYALSAKVVFEEGWLTSTADIREQWDRREQLWEEGQELLRVDDEEGEITRLAPG